MTFDGPPIRSTVDIEDGPPEIDGCLIASTVVLEDGFPANQWSKKRVCIFAGFVLAIIVTVVVELFRFRDHCRDNKMYVEHVEDSFQSGLHFSRNKYMDAINSCPAIVAKNPYLLGIDADVIASIKKTVQAIRSSELEEPMERIIQMAGYVNRWLFVKESFLGQSYFRTMLMKAQISALVFGLGKRLSGDPLNVLIAGCGIGDWNIIAALALPEKSTVWCFNKLESTQVGAKELARKTDLLDLQSMKDDHNDDLATGLHEKLVFRCSEKGKDECSNLSGDILTSNVDEVAEQSNIKFDVVVFGNALLESELPGVRKSLNEGGKAIVPVCSGELFSVQDKGEWTPAHFCKGFWRQLEPLGTNTPSLFEFAQIMRPLD